MKKFEIRKARVQDVINACAHNKNCLDCPFVTKIGSCPFAGVTPYRWGEIE